MNVFGFAMKGVSTYQGHEGETCLVGNLYFKNIKVGSFREETWSGDIEFTLNEKANKSDLEDAARQYFKVHPHGPMFLDYSEINLQELYKNQPISGILGILHSLYFIEQTMKKFNKMGYEMVVFRNNKNKYFEKKGCLASYYDIFKEQYKECYLINKDTLNIVA